GNPYVQTFNRLGSIPNLDDYVIELNTNVTPDQRRYNAPTASQVAAIWFEGNDPQRSFDRSVIIYATGDRPTCIKAYHAHYYLDEDNQQDDYDISNGGVIQSARFVTAREYYCFLIQAREGVFNILLFGG
uniref:Uncharacterized protein n=1 Tax=Zea mays TaxID=4577 RepID=A0A804R7N0_MAIZE